MFKFIHLTAMISFLMVVSLNALSDRLPDGSRYINTVHPYNTIGVVVTPITDESAADLDGLVHVSRNGTRQNICTGVLLVARPGFVLTGPGCVSSNFRLAFHFSGIRTRFYAGMDRSSLENPAPYKGLPVIAFEKQGDGSFLLELGTRRLSNGDTLRSSDLPKPNATYTPVGHAIGNRFGYLTLGYDEGANMQVKTFDDGFDLGVEVRSGLLSPGTLIFANDTNHFFHQKRLNVIGVVEDNNFTH